jgi:hypothetical protein
MELFESHFNNLPKNGCLFYDESRDTFEQFSNIGTPHHVNYLTFRELFRNISKINKKDLIILESGIASAGTNSTYLFNEYVRKYGGRFWSVDINRDLVLKNIGNMCPATTLICNDSVSFFDNWVQNNKDKQADIIYLDSYDLDFNNPTPSGQHGLKEYKALLPVCKKDTLLLIDDTPLNPYWLPFRNDLYIDILINYNSGHKMPGKGMYVLDENKNADILLHNYQVLYKFK